MCFLASKSIKRLLCTDFISKYRQWVVFKGIPVGVRRYIALRRYILLICVATLEGRVLNGVLMCKEVLQDCERSKLCLSVVFIEKIATLT